VLDELEELPEEEAVAPPTPSCPPVPEDTLDEDELDIADDDPEVLPEAGLTVSGSQHAEAYNTMAMRESFFMGRNIHHLGGRMQCHPQ
jgi:hypothetical protein